MERPGQLELQHLFGGIEFAPYGPGGDENSLLTELGEDVWVRGICETELGSRMSNLTKTRSNCPAWMATKL